MDLVLPRRRLLEGKEAHKAAPHVDLVVNLVYEARVVQEILEPQLIRWGYNSF